MNILLIVREEIVCLVIVSFLMAYSVIYCKGARGVFFKMCIAALITVVLDIITVYTINNSDRVSTLWNNIWHDLFFVAALLFCLEYFNYVMSEVYSSEIVKKSWLISSIPLAAYIVYLCFVDIDIVEEVGTCVSMGSGIIVGYLAAAVYFLASIYVVLKNRRKINPMVCYCITTMTIVILSSLVVQVIIPSFLFISADVAMVTIAVFFAIENPAGKYQKKAYFDQATGLRSKTCHEEELMILEKQIKNSKDLLTKITYVLCDMNSLKEVNDKEGHLAGDLAIRLGAKAVFKSLRSAYGVYRIGGDEFAAIYLDTEDESIHNELRQIPIQCEKLAAMHNIKLSMAVGYAKYKAGDTCVRDIMNAADEDMYRNKKLMKK